MKKYLKMILLSIMILFITGCSAGDGGSVNGKYTAKEIYEIASKSVVEITTKDEQNNALSLGSGFVYSANGVIATNYHVIDGATSAVVKLGTTEYSVNKVCAYDIKKDLAFLKINATGLTALKISTRELCVGESVYALGSSRGLTSTLSDGIITSVDREFDGINYIQHNADISNGNSGGPLLNEYCEVIGINTMTIENSQNLNFAITRETIVSLSFENEFTLYQVYKKESDYFEKLKQIIINNDEDGLSGEDDNYFVFINEYKTNNGNKVYIYWEYEPSKNRICVGLFYSPSYMYTMYITKISSIYEYALYDADTEYYLQGNIYANSFTKDTGYLAYSRTNIASASRIKSFRELGCASMHLVLMDLDKEIKSNGIKGGIGVLGFTNYS